jgi:hypothetical protein
MTSRDLVSNIKPVQHVANAAITATNTPTNGVDTAGFESLVALISLGTITNIANSPAPSWSFKFQESDTVNSGFEDVTDVNRVLTGSSLAPVTTVNTSTGVFLTVDAAAEDAAVYAVGLITEKRYVRVVATAANTPGSTPYTVVFILGHANIVPTTH